MNAESAIHVFNVVNGREFRGLLTNIDGQADFETWLPIGPYRIGATRWVQFGRDTRDLAEARELFGRRGCWLIGESVFQKNQQRVQPKTAEKCAAMGIPQEIPKGERRDTCESIPAQTKESGATAGETAL